MKGAMKSVNKTMKKVMKNKMLMYGALAVVIGLLLVGLVMCMRKREGFFNPKAYEQGRDNVIQEMALEAETDPTNVTGGQGTGQGTGQVDMNTSLTTPMTTSLNTPISATMNATMNAPMTSLPN